MLINPRRALTVGKRKDISVWRPRSHEAMFIPKGIELIFILLGYSARISIESKKTHARVYDTCTIEWGGGGVERDGVDMVCSWGRFPSFPIFPKHQIAHRSVHHTAGAFALYVHFYIHKRCFAFSLLLLLPHCGAPCGYHFLISDWTIFLSKHYITSPTQILTRLLHQESMRLIVTEQKIFASFHYHLLEKVSIVSLRRYYVS